MDSKIESLITDYVAILDQNPLDQMEDTYTILLRFAQAVAEMQQK